MESDKRQTNKDAEKTALPSVVEKPVEEKAADSETNNNVQQTATPKQGGGTGFLTFTSVLILAAAVGGGYVLNQKLDNLEQLTADRPAIDDQTIALIREQVKSQLETTLKQELDKSVSNLNDSLSGLSGEVSKIQTGVSSSEQTLVNTVKSTETLVKSSTGEISQAVMQVKTELEQNLKSSTDGLTAAVAKVQQDLSGSLMTVEGHVSSLSDELKKAVTDLNGSLVATSGAIDDLKASTADLRSQFSVAKEEIAKQQAEFSAAIRDSVQALEKDVHAGRNKWGLAEIEHFLTLANQHLQIVGDVPSAMKALQAANDRIDQLNSSVLNPVKSTVEGKIAALKEANIVNPEDISGKLSSLIATIEGLPVNTASQKLNEERKEAVKEVEVETEGVDWAGLAETSWEKTKEVSVALWDGLSKLVIIRREGDSVPVLDTPEQIFFLKQNLQLKLESAQLAVLNKDAATYKSSLSTAEEWLTTHFDSDAEATQKVLTEIKSLAEIEVNPDLPDMSDSLRVLEQVKAELLGALMQSSGGRLS